MSERLADVQETVDRFGRFVMSRVGLARRWEVMDRRPLMPIDFVVFSCEGDESVSDGLAGAAEMAFYGMEIYMKRTGEERKADPKTIPSVYIDAQPGGLEILDPYLRLNNIVPEYRSDQAEYDALTTNILLDKLVALETKDLLMPAGRRTFPDAATYPPGV